MLHSTLPRAFLTPGLKYLGGYYGEDVPGYQAIGTPYPPPIDEGYNNGIGSLDHHHVFPTWHTVQRSASPSPLDLSLKPGREDRELYGEENDEEYSRNRAKKFYRVSDEEEKEESGGAIEDHVESNNRQKRAIIVSEKYEDQVKEETKLVHHRDHEIEKNIYEGNHCADDVEQLDSPVSYARKIILSPGPSIQPAYHAAAALMTPGQHHRHHHHHHQQHQQHNLHGINAPMTPPSTPSPPQCPRKRAREDSRSPISASLIAATTSQPLIKQTTTTTTVVPNSNGKNPPLINEKNQQQRAKKKHARRLKFDEDTSSPVSGTVILGPDEAVVTGDIDPAFNVVEVTEEARAELAKIENRLGPYQCRLCRQLHEDAFQLAQHRCSRIAHVEYRCPECDKRFSCPANLASHRRWHKPRAVQQNDGSSCSVGTSGGGTSPAGSNVGGEFSCQICEAKFSRQAALRKHMNGQHSAEIANGHHQHGRTSTGSTGSNSEGCLSVGVEQIFQSQIGNANLGISTATIEIP